MIRWAAILHGDRSHWSMVSLSGKNLWRLSFLGRFTFRNLRFFGFAHNCLAETFVEGQNLFDTLAHNNLE